MLRLILSLFFLLLIVNVSHAQHRDSTAENKPIAIQDKKGILGKIGKSIYKKDSAEKAPPEIPYKHLIGKTIRNIYVVPFSFNVNVYDTTRVREDRLTRFAQKFHRTSRDQTIAKNIFFKEGEKLLPLQIVDNERYLRDLTYIQDARIEVKDVTGFDSVDVYVITRDIISLGTAGDATSKWARGLVREDNFLGHGNRVSAQMVIDLNRNPKVGYGADFLWRNVEGKFLNLNAGFNNAARTIYDARFMEQVKYFRIGKPMITRYTTYTGGFEYSEHKVNNYYYNDSLFRAIADYNYSRVDGWWGYNFGGRDRMYSDNVHRLRHVVALRGMYTLFRRIPQKFIDEYDFRFANIKGGLLSYSLYRQNFIRSNFVYGFGRTEDLPKGINATITTGIVDKNKLTRNYYGLDFQVTNFNITSGFFTDYILKTSGYVGKQSWQDITLLGQVNMFTPLIYFKNQNWLNRNFFTASATRQINPLLDPPLWLRSDYGLPYFKDFGTKYTERYTIRGESVFFFLKPFWGFKFAPFLFTDFVAARKSETDRIKGYPVFGTGVRTRNESLVFGTLELRMFYMPQVIGDVKNYRIELSSNVRFRYLTRFVNAPNFVNANNLF